MSRRSIHQLSPSLVNRIAAGEVIERPASVVKELVENALDAGATHIVVEIEDGGRELIRVIDDGGGIATGELALAFASHATSKLLSDDDLFDIRTMGFRGEALASIGSVSHARIVSRTAESEAAYEIFNRGGQISDPQATAGNVGTTVEVRNLFFNVPARRKFLKGSATEFGHISDQLLRTALAYPGVTFRLSHNGRKATELAAATELERLLEAWPKEFAEGHIRVDAGDAEISIRGIVGAPELARPTQKYQHLYLNGRPIRDKTAQHALREAYRGLTEPGRYPAAVLLLTVPPGDVDVNVHPTKVEVRFKDSGRIHSLVLSAVRERLLGSDLTPRATASSRGVPMMDDSERQSLQSKLADFFRNPTPAGGQWLPNIPSEPVESVADSESVVTARALDRARSLDAYRDVPMRVATETKSVVAEATTPAVPEARVESVTSKFGKALPAIQLHNSYLVAQSDDGLVIIDQHALHERIMFEELLARVTRGPLESQRLLIPETFSASGRQIALLEQITPLLAKLGVEAHAIGPGAVAVAAFPSFLEKLEPSTFVRELLEKGEQELLDMHEEELLHEILDMMACKAAVKAGDPLTPGEIEALLARRDLVERSSNCPHGRPTTLRLSLRDLEKQFKRTGF